MQTFALKLQVFLLSLYVYMYICMEFLTKQLDLKSKSCDEKREK